MSRSGWAPVPELEHLGLAPRPTDSAERVYRRALLEENVLSGPQPRVERGPHHRSYSGGSCPLLDRRPRRTRARWPYTDDSLVTDDVLEPWSKSSHGVALGRILPAMPNLPSGTVTFLFSDIEGSTALLKQLGDDGYTRLLADHRRILRDSFSDREGHEIDTQGDAFFYSFPRARDAVAAAVEAQRGLASYGWPEGVTVRVRIGLHTGEPAMGEEGYTGLDVVRAARIAAVGRGGQVLLSETTRALVGSDLPDGVSARAIGAHRLKDIDRPEPLHELVMTGMRDATRADPPASELDHVSDKEGASGSDPHPEKFADSARQAIERRVLAELEDALGENVHYGASSQPGDAPRPGKSGKWLLVVFVGAATFVGFVWLVFRLF